MLPGGSTKRWGWLAKLIVHWVAGGACCFARVEPYEDKCDISSLSERQRCACCVCDGRLAVQASDVPSLLRAKAELETRCQMLESQLAKAQVGGLAWPYCCCPSGATARPPAQLPLLLLPLLQLLQVLISH